MGELAPDQVSASWSRAAAGYAEQFERFTALYVDEALDRLGVGPGTRVLDVAAGSGVVTAGALRRGATVVATDFAEGMVAHVARTKGDPDGHPPPVAVMDAQRLAVPDGAADVAVSMFGVMFVPDLAAGLGEMVRAVRPGGRVGVGTWWLDGFNLAQLVGQAVERALPELPPRTAVPTWAAVGSPDGLAAALAAAGLADVEVRTVSRSWRFPDAEGFFRSAPHWSPPMRPLFEHLGEANVALAASCFAEVVAEATEAAGGDGIPTDALVGVGRVPG